MNKIKRLFLKILQNNIIYNEDIVPVVIKDYWFDTTPCITIHGFNRDKNNLRWYTTTYKTVDETHPLYDSENPTKKYPFLSEVTKHSYEIQINVWCNNEREREKIVNQVKKCLFYARNSNYRYCANYDKETNKCSYLDDICPLLFHKK